MVGMKEVVFVYGTLRSGASNDWRMAGARFLGAGRVRGVMVKVDWYPGVVLQGEGWVSGEIYEVGLESLRDLDEFEGVGEGGEYRRGVHDKKVRRL